MRALDRRAPTGEMGIAVGHGYRRRGAAARGVFTVAVWIVAVIWLLPFVFVVMTAVRSQGELLGRGVFSLPSAIRWRNFADAWRIGHFNVYFANSTIVTVVKVPVSILVASLAAYPLAQMRFRLNTAVFLFFLVGLAVPVHVTLLPVFILLKKLGILNTLWGLFPPYIALGLPFQIFVMRGFFRGIPSELLEAARIDGASELTNWWRIMLPLSTPALVTLAIIDGLHTWNEFLLALVLINSDRWKTVPLGLLNFQGEFGSNYPQLTAAILIAVAPILVAYLIFQRYLVSGLTSGAIKG